MTTPVNQRVFYSGRVQGVGFRYSVKQIAQSFEVVGGVRNLPDGRVELERRETAMRFRRFLPPSPAVIWPPTSGRSTKKILIPWPTRVGLKFVTEVGGQFLSGRPVTFLKNGTYCW